MATPTNCMRTLTSHTEGDTERDRDTYAEIHRTYACSSVFVCTHRTHTQVYEFFLRFIVSSEVDIRTLKKYINGMTDTERHGHRHTYTESHTRNARIHTRMLAEGHATHTLYHTYTHIHIHFHAHTKNRSIRAEAAGAVRQRGPEREGLPQDHPAQVCVSVIVCVCGSVSLCASVWSSLCVRLRVCTLIVCFFAFLTWRLFLVGAIICCCVVFLYEHSVHRVRDVLTFFFQYFLAFLFCCLLFVFLCVHLSH